MKNAQAKNKYLAALRAAFPYTVPIFAGFWFLGITYGVLMRTQGFSFWYPMLMSLTIFAGSAEFVAANLLLGAFQPVGAFFLTLMINARHLFYGISMLERYRDVRGVKRIYLIFGMCDESFSINCTADIPQSIDRGWFYFFVTLLNHIYWVTGATLGGLFGALFTFNTEGLDFVMTAMFVVIFLEQWQKDKQHTPALLGLFAFGGLPCCVRCGQLHFAGYGRYSAGAHAFAQQTRKGACGMTMTLSQQVITLACVVFATVLTRFLPFLVFPKNRPIPKFLQYLGKVLPGAVFGLLVIYCLKNVSLLSGSHGIPELIAILVVVALHLWKKQMLLSIAGGTVVYMLLVQFVF